MLVPKRTGHLKVNVCSMERRNSRVSLTIPLSLRSLILAAQRSLFQVNFSRLFKKSGKLLSNLTADLMMNFAKSTSHAIKLMKK
jgi:hypothetical protein